MSKSMSKSKPLRETSVALENNFLHQAVVFGLCLVLFFAPFFRGMFFPLEQRYVLIAAVIIFWLTYLMRYMNGESGFFKHKLDYLILALPLAYLISAFVAVNSQMAIDSLLVNILYAVFYWSAANAIIRPRDIKFVLNTIYIGSILVGIAGLMTATGMININSGFVTSDGGTIASTMQYKNALAVLLTVGVIIGIYLFTRARSKEKYYYVTGNALLLGIMFCTQSDGGYINFIIWLAVLLFWAPKEIKTQAIALSVFWLITGVAASKLMLHAIGLKQYFLTWVIFLLDLVVNLAAYYLLSFLQGRLKALNQRKVALPVLTVIVLLLLAAIIYVFTKHNLLAGTMAGLHMHGALERLTMYQDAWKMILQRPLLGWGGGGWQEAYAAYESYFYVAREAHSYYIQIFLETGIIGIAIFAATWVMVLRAGYKLYQANKDNDGGKFLVITLIVVALAIGAHAAMDFDLSLASLSLILYTMFAILRAKSVEAKPNLPPAKSIVSMCAVTVMSVAVLIGTTAVVSANGSYQAAAQEVDSNQAYNAISYLDQAISSNPFDADYYSLKAQILFSSGKKDEAITDMEKAVRLSQYNMSDYGFLSNYYSQTGQESKAVATAEKAVNLAPLNSQSYEPESLIYLNAGIDKMQKGDKGAAKTYFSRVLAIPAQMAQRVASVSEDKRKLWNNVPLAPTDVIKLNMGKAAYFLGQWDKAQQQYTAAVGNSALQPEATLWQAVLDNKLGHTDQAKSLIAGLQKKNSDLSKQYSEIVKIPTLN